MKRLFTMKEDHYKIYNLNLKVINLSEKTKLKFLVHFNTRMLKGIRDEFELLCANQEKVFLNLLKEEKTKLASSKELERATLNMFVDASLVRTAFWNLNQLNIYQSKSKS